MKKINLINISNVTIIIYFLVWVYYAIFNWDVFSIKLNTNAGFSVIGGLPFVFFFILGLVALLVIRYFIYIYKVDTEKRVTARNHKIAIMEKDIELLKMKEVLFKMQTSEMDKSSSQLNALHEKLDSLTNQISEKDEEEDKKEDIN
jgi:uncharacterized coiled-coil protein SlyX